MNYCPNCGTKLIGELIDKKSIKKCLQCDYIDWDNWSFLSCVVVAYNKDNEFLMVKLKGMEEGRITFPGGFRDIGETLEEAAIREFFEETGMKIRDLKLYNTYTKDTQRLVWVVFKAILDSGEFCENDEVGEIMFFDKDSVINQSILRGNMTKQLLNDILNE